MARTGVVYLVLLAGAFFALGAASNGLAESVLPTLLGAKGAPGLWPLLVVGGLVLGAVVLPLAGRWSDSLPPDHARSRPLFLAAAISVLAIALLTQATSAGGIAVSFLVLQLAIAIGLAAGQPLLAEGVTRERRGLGAGIQGAATLLGALLVTSTGASALLGDAPGDAAVALVALIALPLAATGLLGQGQGPKAGARRWSLPKGAFRRVMVARAVVLFGVLAWQRGLIALVGEVPATSARASATALGLLTLLVVPGAIAGGIMADRAGRKQTALAGLMLVAVGGLLLSWRHAPLELALFGGLATLGSGAVLAASWAWLADLAPRGDAGQSLGFAASAGNLAAVAALGAVGFLAATGHALLPLLIAAPCALLGVLLLRGVTDARTEDDAARTEDADADAQGATRTTRTTSMTSTTRPEVLRVSPRTRGPS